MRARGGQAGSATRCLRERWRVPRLDSAGWYHDAVVAKECHVSRPVPAPYSRRLRQVDPSSEYALRSRGDQPVRQQPPARAAESPLRYSRPARTCVLRGARPYAGRVKRAIADAGAVAPWRAPAKAPEQMLETGAEPRAEGVVEVRRTRDAAYRIAEAGADARPAKAPAQMLGTGAEPRATGVMAIRQTRDARHRRRGRRGVRPDARAWRGAVC